MKKNLQLTYLFLFSLSFLLPSHLEAQSSLLTPRSIVVDKSKFSDKLPAIIDNAGLNRGTSFNGEFVFVASRQTGNKVYYYDVTKPDDAPKELDMTGVTGGLFVINDLATNGKKVYVSNLVTSGQFKVYQWDTLTKAPKVLLDYTTAVRLGDAINVIGDPAKVGYLVASGNNTKDVFIWKIVADTLATKTPLIKTYSHATNTSFARITKIPGVDSLWLMSGSAAGIALLDTSFNVVDTLTSARIPDWPISATVFNYNGRKFLGYTHVRNGAPVANNQNVIALDTVANFRTAFRKLKDSSIVNQIIYQQSIGVISNGNASAKFDAETDKFGNTWIYSYSAGNGFIITRFGNNLPASIDPVFTIMDKTQASGNLPAIIDNAGSTRGASFNGEHVFVASRQGGNKIYYYDVKAPNDDPKELNNTGLSGGTFVVSDVATSGKKIYMSNMVLSGLFKVYQWDNITSSPKVLLDYTGTVRLGDAITVVGDPSKEALLIASAHGTKTVYSWKIVADSIPNKVPTINTYGHTVNTSFARVTAVPGENQYLLSGPSAGLTLLDKDLNLLDTIPSSFFPSWPMQAKVFTYKNQRLLSFVHVRSGAPVENQLYVLDMNKGATAAAGFKALGQSKFSEALIHTKNLGNVSNGNASAGLDLVTDAAGNVWTMAFAAGNGFVVQRFGNISVSTKDEYLKQNAIVVYPNPSSGNITLSSKSNLQVIRMFNQAGSLVLNQKIEGVQNEVTLELPRLQSGLYFIDALTSEGRVTSKVLIQK